MENITIQQEVPQRDSFVFYRSFKNAIDEVKRKGDKLLICQAIIDYALDQKEPQLEGTPKVAWLLIKAQLDANMRRYRKGCRGGAPKGNTNASKPTKKQLENNLKQPNENENENDNENVNGNVNVNGLACETITTTPLFSEIEDYVRDNRLNVDTTHFYDYYSANGWMLGRNPMVDWKAAIRAWNHLDRQSDNTPKTAPIYDL